MIRRIAIYLLIVIVISFTLYSKWVVNNYPSASKEKVTTYIEWLRADNWRTRMKGAEMLRRLGIDAIDAKDELYNVVNDDHWEVRLIAGKAIVPLSETSELVKIMNIMLTDEHEYIREFAAGTLIMTGKDGRVAVPNLLRAIDDDYVAVQIAAGEALGSVGADEEIIERLTKELQDKNPHKRKHSARALGYLGRYAESGLPMLMELVETENDIIVKNAALKAVDDIERSLRELDSSHNSS